MNNQNNLAIKTFCEVDTSPSLFDTEAAESLSRSGNPHFWRQFYRAPDYTNYYTCFGFSSPDDITFLEVEKVLRHAIRREPSFSIVEEYYHAGTSHYLVKWSGGLWRPAFWKGMLPEGIVFSITQHKKHTVFPYITAPTNGGVKQGKVSPFYLLFLAVPSLLGIVIGSLSVLLSLGFAIAQIIKALWDPVFLSSVEEVTAMEEFALGLPAWLGLSLMVVFGLGYLVPSFVGFRNAYIAYKRGVGSPEVVNLIDLTKATEQLTADIFKKKE